MTDWTAPPRTASAADRPCQLRTTHGFPVVVTQGHHRHPIFLQNRAYGEIRDPELLWVCGTDHDSIHAALYHLLGERPKPAVDPGRLVWAEARQTYDWYRGAL